jgi:hypothetical protein
LHGDGSDGKQTIGTVFERGEFGIQHHIAQGIESVRLGNPVWLSATFEPVCHLSPQLGPDGGPKGLVDQRLRP